MIVIRRAEPDDSEAISRVLHESFIEYKALYPLERYKATVLSTEGVRERLREGPVWVGLTDEAIVGTVSIMPRAEGLYIRGMGIVPQARGLRLGRQLLIVVEDYARENGFQRMYLGTIPFLTRAIRLYEQFGFVFNKDRDEYSHGMPLLCMEKWLV